MWRAGIDVSSTILLVALASACLPGKPQDPTDSGTTGGTSGAGDTGATSMGVGASTAPGSTGPGESTTGPAEFTGTDGADDASGTDGAGGVHHPACAVPLPDPPPPLPHVNFDGDMPTFAKWQALECDVPAVMAESACAADGECEQSNCVDFGSGAGVCSYGDIDVWCDGEGELMGSTDGVCWICVEPAQHARACCEHPGGVFDCRHWPFTDTPGIVGQVCATHEDCEPGLACSEPFWYEDESPTGQPCNTDDDCDEGVCSDKFGQCVIKSPHFAGYGICACPGTDHTLIVPPDSCF